MIQVVLTKEHLQMITDLAECHVRIGAWLRLYERGSIPAEGTLTKLKESFNQAEEIWNVLRKEGL
jgi:hypothetical protein